MHDLAIVFIYTEKNTITNINLQSIIENNKDIPIVQVNYRDFNQAIPFLGETPLNKWSVRKLWYSCDSIFLYWYLNSSLRAKNYLLVEWDTYCNNVSFHKFLGDQIFTNTGLTSSKIINIDSHPHDVWFTNNENKKILYSLFGSKYIRKYSPMSCSTISDECVNAIIHYLKNNPIANDLYIETKFGTIANYLDYPVESYHGKFYDYITYHENTCENTIKKLYGHSLEGIFHPIKKYQIYRKYFANNNTKKNKDIKIHYAIYGSLLDLTKDMNFFIDNNIDNITIDNNIGGDPAPFRSKQMMLRYEKNGQIFEKVVNEGENLDLSDL